MKKLEKAVGNFVTGDKFWNREKEIELFAELLDEGAHILMAAPRRIGKTSLMREIALRIRDKYYCLHVDLQKAESPADAVAELGKATRPHEKLWGKTKGIFQNILGKVTENIESIGVDELTVTLRSGMTSVDWQSKGDQLFSTLSETDMPVIIFFDELPILINRMLKGKDYKITPERKLATDNFMSWIRDISIRYNKKIRLVITGSIGIEPVLRQADLSATLNTFTPFVLPPWEKETAIECLQALANRYGISFEGKALDAIIERLGYLIPHHVQMFFSHIYDDCRREILEILQHDGYLKREGESFVFVSNLLKDWWKAHFSFGYIPVSKRGR